MILYHQSGVIIFHIGKAPSKIYSFKGAKLTYVLFLQSVVCFNFIPPSFVNYIRKLYSRYFLQITCNNIYSFNFFYTQNYLVMSNYTPRKNALATSVLITTFLVVTKTIFPNPHGSKNRLIIHLIYKNSTQKINYNLLSCKAVKADTSHPS